MSILYSGLVAWIKTEDISPVVMGREMKEQDAVFVESLGWFPWYFLFTLALVIIFYRFRFQKN